MPAPANSRTRVVMNGAAANRHDPFAVARFVTPADDAAKQLAIKRFQLSNQLLCPGVRKTAECRRRMQQAGER